MSQTQSRSNPITDSVVEIARLELKDDLIACHKFAVELLGDAYEETIRSVTASVEACRRDCKPGTSYLSAGLLMTMSPSSDMTEEENILTNKIIKATIYRHIIDNRKKL